MQTKVCNDCKEELTIDNFYVCKRYSDGFRGQCKKCRKIRYAEWTEKNKEAILKKKIENKEIKAEYLKRYRKEHPKERAEHDKKRYLKDKTKILEYCKKYREENPEKRKEAVNNWYHNNRAICNGIKQNRRMKEHKLVKTLTIAQWEDIKNYFNNKCCYCGRETKLTQDHLIPVSKNGIYDIKNIVPACITCNSSKGNREFTEWYIKYRHYSEKRKITIFEFLEYAKGVS